MSDKQVKGKGIPVTDRGGLSGRETSRLPHFLENVLIYDGKVVIAPAALYPQENSWYSPIQFYIYMNIDSIYAIRSRR
jgi:hypothetical protein